MIERRLNGLEPDDRIFSYKGRKWYDYTIASKLREACEKADIPYGDKNFDKKGNRIGIAFHYFRHHADSRIMPTPLRVFPHAAVIPAFFSALPLVNAA